jgi:hypothetical protein
VETDGRGQDAGGHIALKVVFVRHRLRLVVVLRILGIVVYGELLVKVLSLLGCLGHNQIHPPHAPHPGRSADWAEGQRVELAITCARVKGDATGGSAYTEHRPGSTHERGRGTRPLSACLRALVVAAIFGYARAKLVHGAGALTTGGTFIKLTTLTRCTPHACLRPGVPRQCDARVCVLGAPAERAPQPQWQ